MTLSGVWGLILASFEKNAGSGGGILTLKLFRICALLFGEMIFKFGDLGIWAHGLII